jgi:CheY-like chemotaxis protein
MSRFVYLIDADSNLNEHLLIELSRSGFRVEANPDANDVMARKDDLPALIVLCIDPKRTGWAVCNRLRKSASLKTVPLIITSAEATEKDFEDHKKLKTRAEDYLHKPFGVDALVDKIAAQIGMPEPINETSGLLSIDAEEIAVEDDNLIVEEDEPLPAASDTDENAMSQRASDANVFGNEDSSDRTRIGAMNIDQEVNVETDAAFAAIGLEPDENGSTNIIPQEELRGGSATERQDVRALPTQRQSAPVDDPLDEGSESPFDGPAPLPEVEPEPMPAKAPSVDLDLGLDAVAKQAAERPLGDRVRRKSQPEMILSSAPAPAHVTAPAGGVHDTAAHDTSSAVVHELKAERDKLRRDVDELHKKLAAKPESAPAPSSGFSREREFLNLREIINKKEKEILDLRDSTDAKERQILDGKDKLRELERRVRDLDEKALTTERELVAAKEKVEALGHDKERVVEREKQVKGRLDDALKSNQRYEEELEAWKKRHAEDVAALEANYNETVAQHQQEVADLKNRQSQALEAAGEQHGAQLREAVERHEAEKQGIIDRHAEEKGRIEADAGQQMQRLRESKDNERESLRVRFEQQNADITEQHQVELQAIAEQNSGKVAQLVTDHEAQMSEKDQLHADELGGMRARYTQDTKAAERKHAEEVAKLHESYKGELSQAEQRRVDELAQKAAEHQQQIEAQSREALVEKGRLEREHEEALQAAEQRRESELGEAEQRRSDALLGLRKELEQKLADELKGARDSHMRKLQTLEESHADVKAGMTQRHQQQVEELTKQHADTVSEFENALKERDGLITEGHTRINELEGTLGEEQASGKKQQQIIADLEQKLAQAKGDIADREGKIAEKAQRVSELETESAGYQDQILKAYQRIKSDESIVSRAKKALAIALTLLDESAADGSDEASS